MPERYHKNVPGPFYVEDGYCISCGAPEAVAPDLMAHDDENDHCYFKRQPVTPKEWEQALAAVNVCCCGAVTFTEDLSGVPRHLKPQVEEAIRSIRESWTIERSGPLNLVAIEKQATREGQRAMMLAIVKMFGISGGFVALYLLIDFLLR